MKRLYIESQKNPKVQTFAGLKTKKGRTRDGMFLAEGERLAREALQSDCAPQYLLLDASAEDEFAQLRTLASSRGAEVYELSPQAFAAVSDTVTPQGVIAVLRQPTMVPVYPSQVLALDGVQDPGNLGTLLRTSDAFDVNEVCCSPTTADPLSPKVVRASMGGAFRLSLVRMDVGSYGEAWQASWPDGQVIITEASGALMCNQVDFTKPTLVVIGSEATGVSESVRQRPWARVSIPMATHVDSLNAAVAGSILLYEAYRQRQS